MNSWQLQFFLTHNASFYFHFSAKLISKNCTWFEDQITRVESEKMLIFFCYHLNLFIYCKTKLRIKSYFLQNDFFYRMKCFFTEWNCFTRLKFFYRMNFFYGTKLSLQNNFFTERNFFYRTKFFRKGHKYFFANKVFFGEKI